MRYLLYAIIHYTLCDEIMNVLCNNKKAGFKYAFIKKLEAGLVLSGWEVKSLKAVFKLETLNIFKCSAPPLALL